MSPREVGKTTVVVIIAVSWFLGFASGNLPLYSILIAIAGIVVGWFAGNDDDDDGVIDA